MVNSANDLDQLLAHLAGDYVVQTHHMANEKTISLSVAALHAATYTACFLPLTRDPRRLAVIGLTHLVIDHWRLARTFVWAKNHLAPRRFRPRTSDLYSTGAPGSTPDYIGFWVMIICDNTIHLMINRAALSVGRRKK